MCTLVLLSLIYYLNSINEKFNKISDMKSRFFYSVLISLTKRAMLSRCAWYKKSFICRLYHRTHRAFFVRYVPRDSWWCDISLVRRILIFRSRGQNITRPDAGLAKKARYDGSRRAMSVHERGFSREQKECLRNNNLQLPRRCDPRRPLFRDAFLVGIRRMEGRHSRI